MLTEWCFYNWQSGNGFFQSNFSAPISFLRYYGPPQFQSFLWFELTYFRFRFFFWTYFSFTIWFILRFPRLPKTNHFIRVVIFFTFIQPLSKRDVALIQENIINYDIRGTCLRQPEKITSDEIRTHAHNNQRYTLVSTVAIIFQRRMTDHSATRA